MSLNPPIEINIQVYIRQFGTGGQIQLSETFNVDTDFLGLAAIMERFHDLSLELQMHKATDKDKR